MADIDRLLKPEPPNIISGEMLDDFLPPDNPIRQMVFKGHGDVILLYDFDSNSYNVLRINRLWWGFWRSQSMDTSRLGLFLILGPLWHFRIYTGRKSFCFGRVYG